eukprot:gene11420-23892_t
MHTNRVIRRGFLLRVHSTTSFKAVVEKLNASSNNNTGKEMTPDKKLNLYALYKQATAGPCKGDRPGLFDFVNRAKYDAWHALGNMSAEDAGNRYIQLVNDQFKDETNSNAIAGEIPVGATNTLKPVIGESAPIMPNITSSVDTSHVVSVSQLGFPFQQKKVNEVTLLTIATQLSEGVLGVTLNRPQKRNAFNMHMWADFKHIFAVANGDESVRVAVLSGAGGHFSSGMDLSVFSQINALTSGESCDARRREGLANIIQYLQDAVSATEQCRIPVIAAITGHCIGGAVDVICACDLRYCTVDASFSIKETDLAMVADIGTLQRLPKLIGDQRVRELAYTGRTVTGEEAERIGLVAKCFSSSEDMWKHVNETAQTIAKKSPLAI